MYFWSLLNDKPEKNRLRRNYVGIDRFLYLCTFLFYPFTRINFSIILLLLLTVFSVNAQNKTDQILFSIFELHCELIDKDFKSLEYQTYYILNNNGVISKGTPVSFSEAKNKAVKHSFTSQFNKNRKCSNITVTDNLGNIWTQEPHYNKDSCTNIYWYKNNNLYALYKLCHMPDGNCYLVNLMNKSFRYTGASQPTNQNIFEIHLSRFPDDNFISDLRPDYIHIYDGIDYDFCLSKNKKNKQLKKVSFEYNEHGDWIKLIWYNRKKEPLYITERTISYYTADKNFHNPNL